MSGLGSRIRSIRDKAGLSQEHFGKMVGASARKISAVESEITRPDQELLVAIRKNFGVSTDWILTGEDALQPVMLPADHVPIKRQLQDLVEAMKGGVIERIADEEAEYLAKVPGSKIPVFQIEGDRPIPYDGDRPARTSDVYSGSPPGLDDPAAFACELADDSMEPDFIKGDLLYFSPAAETRDGDYACVRLDEKSTFRQVFIQDDIMRLVAANRKFPELRLARDQVKSMFRLVWRMTRY